MTFKQVEKQAVIICKQSTTHKFPVEPVGGHVSLCTKCWERVQNVHRRIYLSFNAHIRRARIQTLVTLLPVVCFTVVQVQIKWLQHSCLMCPDELSRGLTAKGSQLFYCDLLMCTSYKLCSYWFSANYLQHCGNVILRCPLFCYPAPPASSVNAQEICP